MDRSMRPSKKDFKQQKQSYKQQYSYSRRQAEQELKNLQQDKSQSQYQDPRQECSIFMRSLKKAKRWWERIDEKYFKTLTLEDVLNKREICTTNQVLGLADSQVTPMGNYRQEILEAGLGHLLDRNKFRVLFRAKAGYQAILAVYGVEPAIPNYHTQQHQNLDQQGIKITLKAHHSRMLNQDDNTTNPQSKQVRLELQDCQQNQLMCQRIQKYQQIGSNSLYLHQIDKELAIWQWQLQRVNRENHINWNKLIKNVQNNQSLWRVRQVDEFDGRIREYRDRLYWGTVLRSFQRGFKDKTKKMLETYRQNQKNFNLKPPKGLPGGGHHQKKLFETDCKICFCSDNSDSNQVLYCDNCNTSFHLICYGLTSIPPQDQYFCQRCAYIRKQQNIQGVKLKKPYCQICLRTNFPMKKLDDHFYHVTCLVLFNFVQFRENKMVLKGSLAHQNIVKMVIENQIMHEQCNQCRKINGGTELGMQIKCSYEGCQNYCHPICAYLNGYKFDLKSTNNCSLQVKMFCNSDHLGARVEQVYLRRFLCNLNETSSKSEKQIKALVETQQQNLVTIKEALVKTRKKYPNRILIMTKFIKNLLKSRMQRGEQQIQTQTQSILRKLKNKHS